MRRVAYGVALLLVVVVLAGVVGWRLAHREDSTPVGGPCTDPVYATSAEQSLWVQDGYRVEQDMWNNTVGTQVMHACTYRSWYVTSMQPDTPEVKAYPDVNVELHSQRVDSFSRVTSRFGSAGPGDGAGVYEYAYDIWINGVATETSTEIMIWTDNHGNVLHVPQRGTFTSGGRSYSAWRAGSFIAYVADMNTSSGELDLKSFFDHALARGWMPADSRISRIEFGIEICSTAGRSRTYGVTDFSVETA